MFMTGQKIGHMETIVADSKNMLLFVTVLLAKLFVFVGIPLFSLCR